MILVSLERLFRRFVNQLQTGPYTAHLKGYIWRILLLSLPFSVGY